MDCPERRPMNARKTARSFRAGGARSRFRGQLESGNVQELIEMVQIRNAKAYQHIVRSGKTGTGYRHIKNASLFPVEERAYLNAPGIMALEPFDHECDAQAGADHVRYQRHVLPGHRQSRAAANLHARVARSVSIPGE